MSLPPCDAFLIEAIREARTKPKGDKYKAAFGVGLKKVYPIIVAAGYTYNAYREALMELLQKERILILYSRSVDGPDRSYDVTKDIVLTPKDVPDWYDLNGDPFYTNMNDRPLDAMYHKRPNETVRDHRRRLKEVDHAEQYGFTVYVIEDGLPDRAQKALDQKEKPLSLAQKQAATVLKRLRSTVES